MPAPGQTLNEPDLWRRLGDALEPMTLGTSSLAVRNGEPIPASPLLPKPGELLALTGIEPRGDASASELAIDAGLMEAKRLGLRLERWQMARLLTASGVASIPAAGR